MQSTSGRLSPSASRAELGELGLRLLARVAQRAAVVLAVQRQPFAADRHQPRDGALAELLDQLLELRLVVTIIARSSS